MAVSANLRWLVRTVLGHVSLLLADMARASELSFNAGVRAIRLVVANDSHR